MRVNDEITIEEGLIEERYTRASGPGGQHVNTSETAVQLRFDMARSDLPGPMKERLRRLAGSRLTKDGVVIIHVEDERSRERNREIARARLKGLLDKASKKPKPRKKTRPSLSSVKRQKKKKAEHAEKKALRKPPKID
ncbi:MAG: alternative ribosome rescue aminoacyl-tRNA hydrolase ArfB [Oceanicaulis sp.]